MGKIGPGSHRIETPVGTVEAKLDDEGMLTIRNVPAYRHEKQVTINVPGVGSVTGDVAWGGNWFFLIHGHNQKLSPDNVETLAGYAWKIRQALRRNGITGAGGMEIDHIELYGNPTVPGAHSKNFVLCPGRAYDRSPCGTGTSAKLACLYADGKLKPGQVWRQESIVGSVFEGTVSVVDGKVYPEITGYAYVNAESDQILDEADPFCYGIRKATWTRATT
jgi:4-hydroxyproline epimerase